MDEDRPTDDNQRGDALRPRPGAAGGDDATAGPDPLPTAVRRRLDSCAADWVRENAGLPARQSRTGWFVAAACFVLAVAGWWPRLSTLAPFDNGTSVGQFSADWSRQHLLDVGGARGAPLAMVDRRGQRPRRVGRRRLGQRAADGLPQVHRPRAERTCCVTSTSCGSSMRRVTSDTRSMVACSTFRPRGRPSSSRCGLPCRCESRWRSS